MKRGILGLLLCVVVSVSAQTLQDNELAVVYYMPQTQLCFDVEYEEVILHKGLFAQYAKQYLGATDIIEEDARSFRLLAITPKVYTIADYTRAYKVVAEKDIDSQLLTLTNFGTLAGFNITAHEDRHKPAPAKTETVKENELKVLPLLEEHVMNNKTIAQQAHGAAKLIFRIREYRMYLLGGEIDKVPADGKAMQIVLDELNKQEQQLVELFIGRREVIKHHKKLYYTPVKTEEVELGFFSDKDGFTTEDGEPITLNITARRLTKGTTRNEKESKKAPQPSQIFYNLPGSANYKIVYLNETIVERNTPVAQFGISVPLARNLFTRGELPRIQFDIKTGNIKSIEK